MRFQPVGTLNDRQLHWTRTFDKEPLDTDDVSFLEMKYGLTPETIKTARLRYFSSDKAQEFFSSDYSGFVIPYVNLDLHLYAVQLRCIDEQAPHRYVFHKGTNGTLYFSPGHVEDIVDPKKPLLIAEGPFKCLRLQQEVSHAKASYAVAAISSCTGYTDKGREGLSAAFNRVPLAGRTVHVLPDTDFFTNPKVFRGYEQFLELLRLQKAVVTVFDLRTPSDKSTKVGVDDYIQQHGMHALSDLLEEKPTWNFSVVVSPVSGSEEDVRSFLSNFVAASASTQNGAIDLAKKLSDFSKPSLRRFMTDETSTWKALCQEGEVAPTFRDILENKNLCPDKSVSACHYVAKGIAAELEQSFSVFKSGDLYFIREKGGSLAIEFGSKDFNRYLLTKYSIPSVHKKYDELCEEIEAFLYRLAQPAKVVYLTYYEHFEKTFYLTTSEREAYRVSASGAKYISIADAPAVIRGLPGQKPLVPVTSPQIGLLKGFIKSFRLAQNRFSHDDVFEVLCVSLVACLYVKKDRPIFLFLGPKGTGKSTLMAFLSKMICGAQQNIVGSFNSSDDFRTSVSNSFLMPIDNVEQLSTAIINDMCMVVTGGVFKKRKLYSNNEEVEFHPDTVMMLTARSKDFIGGRDDLNSRLLTIELAPRESSSESELIDEAAEIMRNHFYSWLCEELPAIMERLEQTKNLSIECLNGVRLAGFCDFVYRAFGPEVAGRVAHYLVKSQGWGNEGTSQSVLSQAWVRYLLKVIPNLATKVDYTAAELADKVNAVSESEAGERVVKNAAEMGLLLSKHQGVLASIIKVQIDKQNNTNHYRLSLAPSQVVPVEEQIEDLTAHYFKVEGNGGGGGVFNEFLKLKNKI